MFRQNRLSKERKQELKVVRNNLAERLYAMKQLLARPGRAGQVEFISHTARNFTNER